jgi:hypothetical protein
VSRFAGLGRHRFALVLLLLAVLCGTGIALYLDERDTRQQTHELVVPAAKDWIELDVTSQEVDPGKGQLTLYVVPVPHGSLAQSPDLPLFTRQIEITVESVSKTTLKTTPGEQATAQTVPVAIYGGTETDYPFDRYRIAAFFSAYDGQTAVPVGLYFTDADPFFFVRPTSASPNSGAVLLEARATRARSTFILAWFMIAAMWALALAVLAGAEVLYRGRQGLVWPSLGWMAATLFALIGMRNAAPGSPPIGSLLDYVSFFWAEGIIAACLVFTVVSGTRVDHRRLAEAEAKT